MPKKSTVVTPIGRICFPTLFQPRSGGEGQEPRYSVVLLFDPVAQKTPEYSALKQAVFDAGVEEWGEQRMRDAAFFRSLRLPFRAAGDKDYEGFEEGFTFVTARSKDRPGVVDARLQDITVPADVFAGQLGRAYVSAFAYDFSGNKGLSLGLNHVQITKADMPRIDGRLAANKVFGTVEDDSKAPTDDPF
jgi:hypothetical protein